MTAFATIPLMLRHELRLSWRPVAARTSHKLMVGGLIAFVVMMHLMALPLPFALDELPAFSRLEVLAGVSATIVGALVMMVSLALIGAVQLIYSRNDMDLLLSSPIPRQSIIFTRLLTLAVSLLGLAALFTLPVANVMVAFGYWRFLVMYPVLLCLGITATAIGVLLAQAMFSILGPRRTRLFSQIFAALLGVAFLCAVNLHNILPQTAQKMGVQTLTDFLKHLPSADSWVWLPARAAIGEPLPFLIGTVLCVALFVATTFGLANRLIDSAITANGASANTVKTRSSGMLASRGGPVTVMRRKEWLLIGRDPWLMSQIGTQLLVMLPAMFLIGKSSEPTYLWLMVIFLAGHLGGALAWLTISTEESPDLLATAPVSRRDVLWAKLQAALVPTAALAAVPVAIAASMNLWVGFTLLVCGAGSALSTAILHVRNPRIAKRKEIGWRGNGNKLIGITEMLLSLVWALFGFLMLALGWWGMLSLLLPLPVIAYMLLRR
jgi:ABC-2 type transport system permease protein